MSFTKSINYLHTLIHRLHNPDLGALLIRVALAATFINAGWFKLTHMELVVTSFVSVGIPAVLAYLVAVTEFLGGFLLLLGIFARYVGIMLAIIMIVAITKVHYAHGYSLANGGYEYVLVLLFASLAMVTLGSGRYSLAYLLKQEKFRQLFKYFRYQQQGIEDEKKEPVNEFVSQSFTQKQNGEDNNKHHTQSIKSSHTDRRAVFKGKKIK